MSKRESMTDKLRRMNAERQASEPIEQDTESRISETRVPDFRSSDNGTSDSGLSGPAHPEPGGRGDFLKVTVTMDPNDFEAINAEMVRRKRAKEKGAQLSGCIREAIRFWRAAGMPRQE